METYSNRLARDQRIVDQHGHAAWSTPDEFWYEIQDRLSKDDSFGAKAQILRSICTQGLFNRGDIAEASYAAQSGHERTPAVGRDFANGTDMKTVVAQFRSEGRRNGKQGHYELRRRRAKISDINKPGGLVVLVDLTEVNCVDRAGQSVTQTYLAIPASSYVKWVKNAKGDTVLQSSLTIDFNEYGEVCGTRSSFQLSSFEELCQVQITPTGIVRPKSTVGGPKVIISYNGPMWSYNGSSTDVLP